MQKQSLTRRNKNEWNGRIVAEEMRSYVKTNQGGYKKIQKENRRIYNRKKSNQTFIQ